MKNPFAWMVRHDPEFDEVVGRHEAKTTAKKWLYVGLHLLPGLLGYIGIFYFREPLMAATGMSNPYANLVFLGTMASVWHIGLPLFMLRKVERLSWREVAVFLGLHRIDIKGLLTTVPLLTLGFVIVSYPYVKFVHPLIYAWLNQFPAIAIHPWHLLSVGYYNFTGPVLAFVFVSNFLGEELYFRGYLQSKLNGVRHNWVWCAFLFEIYHLWQIPMNWAYFPIAPLIPFNIIMKLRRSLYGAIVFHIFANLFWDGIIESMTAVLGW